MKVLSCGSGKGGVGKTTAAMLMAQMWRQQFSVAVIDLNPVPQSHDWAKALVIDAIHWPDVKVVELKKLLASLDRSIDIAIIDLPPASSAAIGASIASSNSVLIPFHATAWELRGMEVLVSVIELTKKLRPKPLTVIGLPCRADPRQKEARFDFASLPFEVLYAPAIHRRVEIERAASAHADLFTAEPLTKAQVEIHACSRFVLQQLLENPA